MFKKKYEPDLVDLDDYKYSLLNSLDNGGTLRPFSTIPGLLNREWSCEEMEAMRKNRRLAQDIYEEMKKRHSK